MGRFLASVGSQTPISLHSKPNSDDKLLLKHDSIVNDNVNNSLCDSAIDRLWKGWFDAGIVGIYDIKPVERALPKQEKKNGSLFCVVIGHQKRQPQSFLREAWYVALVAWVVGLDVWWEVYC
jgi:hypothetical protein